MLLSQGKGRSESVRFAGGKLSRFIILLLAALFLPFLSSAALAQDVGARLSRLENEIDTLSRAVFRGETPPPSAYQGRSAASGGEASVNADVAVRLSQMERELATLTGKIEEQDYRMRQLENGLMQVKQQQAASPAPVRSAPVASPMASVMPDLSTRSKGMESMSVTGQGVANDNSPVKDQTLGVLRNPLTNGVADTPDALYNQAFSLLKSRQYEQADALFGNFLTRYPDHNLAGNARYWRGETFYVRGQYESAARLFAEGYQKDPKGAKGPDNLLKLGLSLAGIGKKDDACLTMGQLLKEYTTAPAPILDRTETERRRLGCQ